MDSKRNEPRSSHPKGEKPRGFDGSRSPAREPDDDDPKSSGFLSQGDGPLPEKDQARGPQE